LRWRIAILVSAAIAISYLDRQTLPVAVKAISADIPLSNEQFSTLQSAFLFAYALMYAAGGKFVDILGTRRGLTAIMVFWSFACASHALATGFVMLAISRFLLGVGEGGGFPAATRAVAEWFPTRERATAMGIINAGTAVGAILAPPLIAAVLGFTNWRWIFVLTGGFGLLWAVWWNWSRFPAAESSNRMGVAPEAMAGAAVPMLPFPWTRLFFIRETRGLVAAKFLSDAAWFFYLFWIPAYFQDVRGLSLARVGKLLWIPYFCSFIGALAGAAASGALIRKGWGVSRSRKTVLLAAAFLAAISACAGFASLTVLALALVSLALFSHQIWSTNIHTAITEISPSKHVAILYGISGAGGTFVGAGAQLVIGRLIDLHGYKPAFVGAGGMYVLAAGLLLSAGVLEPIRRKATGLSPSFPVS